MDIQADKIEIIKLIASSNSEQLIRQVKDLLVASKKQDKVSREAVSKKMATRLAESRQQIEVGKGVPVNLDDIWK